VSPVAASVIVPEIAEVPAVTTVEPAARSIGAALALLAPALLAPDATNNPPANTVATTRSSRRGRCADEWRASVGIGETPLNTEF